MKLGTRAEWMIQEWKKHTKDSRMTMDYSFGNKVF